ncbi:AAA family ATPase [Thiovibrio sp. JS02]
MTGEPPLAGNDSPMLLTCPHCRKQYRLDRAKIPPSLKTARCKACGATFPLPPAAGRRPRRLAVSLNRAGMGKTSAAVNLAAGLALAGARVLLVDADPQGQAASYLGVEPKGGLGELITGALPPEEALVKARDNLWLLAGGKGLAGLQDSIGDRAGGGRQVVAEALAPREQEFAYVLVDTSPDWDPLTISVLSYVRELLIPVSLEVMSVQGFGEFLQLLEALGRSGKELRLGYILPTFYDQRVRKSVDILAKFRNVYGDLVCAPIRYSGQLKECQALGQTPFDAACQAKGVQDYQDLVRKVAADPLLVA